MTRSLAFAAALWAACLGGCATRATGPAGQPPAVAPAPVAPPGGRPLVVSIVVDQLAAWIAAERLPQLPADGGFARLRREGLYVEDLVYAHAATDTAPGHAALYTGRVPRETAIVSNETIAGPGQAPRSILADPATKLIGASAGKLERAGSSLGRLPADVETVADRFVAEVAGAQVFSFSLKDRGALFASGRRPELALWLDVESQELVTSSFFPTPPAWVAPLAGKDALAALAREGWALGADEQAWVSAHAETPDAQEGEGDYAGLGVSFPHPIGSAKALRATPQGDRLLFDVARAAVDAARASNRPTLLALSLSSHDYVAHVFGPHSWETWDELYRLDRALGDFLTFLDRSVGPSGYDVMLTADHGSVALPELSETASDPWCVAVQRAGGGEDRWQRSCARRQRLVPAELLPALEKAANATLGPGRAIDEKWLAGIAEPYLYLGPKARALPPRERARLLAAVTGVLRPRGILQVVDARTLTGPCARDGMTVDDLVCRSSRPDSDGDFYLLVEPGTFFDPALAVGKGSSHGSPYLYDRAVPLLVRAPGRVTPGQVRSAPESFASFAKTLSALLGIHAPASDWGGADLTAPNP